MSMPRPVDVTCPVCHQEAKFTIWQSVNTELDPELKAAVRDRSLFTFTCPHCGQRTNVNYGFLYHQMEDRILIHYATSDEEAASIAEFYGPSHKMTDSMPSFRENGYTIRVVRSQNQLLEKLAIFDAGMDDRIIELYKVFLIAQAISSEPGIDQSEILMFSDGDRHILQILTGKEKSGFVDIDMEMYQRIRDSLGKYLPPEKDQPPQVDRTWALDYFASCPKK